MTSSNSKFQKPRKMTLANILEIICVKFHQNRFICLGCRDDTHRRTDRQTDRRTDAHTHTLGSIATYSVKMTEYKKCHFGLKTCFLYNKIVLSQKVSRRPPFFLHRSKDNINIVHYSDFYEFCWQSFFTI